MSSSYSSEMAKTGVTINEEELRYMYASNVNISNFVSVKLLDKSYKVWKKQMLCLLDSQNMRGLVDAGFKLPKVKSSSIMNQYTSLVEGWIYGSLSEDFLMRAYNSGGPQQIWSTLERLYEQKEVPKEYDPAKDLEKRVSDMLFPKQVEVATLTETPTPDNDDKLVIAVIDGRWLEVKLILENDKEAATKMLTGYGYTIFHIAVIAGRNDFLERLLDFIDEENKIKVTTRGYTALHQAAIFNNKRAAQLLVKKCEGLLLCDNGSGEIPLHTAYKFKSLDTFLYLLEAVKQYKPEALIYDPDPNDKLSFDWKRNIKFDFLEDAISKKQYDLASRLVMAFPQVAIQDDKLLMAMARTFPSDLSFGEAFICPSLNDFHQKIIKRSSSLTNVPRVLYTCADNVLWATRSFKETMRLLQETVIILLVPIAVLYALYELIRLLILVILYPFFMLYFLMWKVLAVSVMPIKHIEKKRKKYYEAKDFLNVICNQIHRLGDFPTRHPCYKKPFVEAICQGAYAVVDEILYRSPNLLLPCNEEDFFFIVLAITQRAEKIYNIIYHLNLKMDRYRMIEDSSRNNILHKAGRLAPASILSRTTGAALQLQRELQWFQEVEKLMLPGDLAKKNADLETPHMVFTREHADLVKEGEQWMKSTSEACSITAALIVTIVFAAAITVPGGNDQEKGTPLFKKESTFIIFAVCDAISLFSAASALLVFLSILTTRFAEKDFLVSLPRRLIIGLCTLFLSTASMMVAFSAILFLVFCDQRPWMLAPIGGLACMPIGVIVTLQLPLLVDLFKSTYIPIFGKQKYIAAGKFISNHRTWVYKS